MADIARKLSVSILGGVDGDNADKRLGKTPPAINGAMKDFPADRISPWSDNNHKTHHLTSSK